jgi:hypothetical protein
MRREVAQRSMRSAYVRGAENHAQWGCARGVRCLGSLRGHRLAQSRDPRMHRHRVRRRVPRAGERLHVRRRKRRRAPYARVRRDLMRGRRPLGVRRSEQNGPARTMQRERGHTGPGGHLGFWQRRAPRHELLRSQRLLQHELRISRVRLGRLSGDGERRGPTIVRVVASDERDSVSALTRALPRYQVPPDAFSSARCSSCACSNAPSLVAASINC